MTRDLIAYAVAVAQEHNVDVFPVASDKRPVVKGWRDRATSDPEEIAALFSAPGAAGIGVPCGPDNDLIAFDLDFGHTNDPDRIAKLNAWLERWQDDINSTAMVRKTRSGGLHVIYAWPQGKGKPPRRIMPKMDVITDGFYFVWDMADGGYDHLQGEIVGEPADGMLEVVERDQFGDGSAMMSADAAHEAMWTDGESGIRHDALLRMTQDWAADHPEENPEALCASFADWFTDIYGDRIDPERLTTILHWETDSSGALVGELGRAFAGISNTPERTMASLQAIGQQLMAAGKLDRSALPAPTNVKNVASRQDREETAERMLGEFTDIDLNVLRTRELPDIDWIVDDLLPAGNLVSISGQSGAGKTRFVALLMAALSTGQTEKIGLPPAVRPIRSLFIANEERTQDVERRLKAAAELNNLTGDMLVTVRGKEHGRFHLIGADGEVIEEVVDKLCDVINDRGIELVMIDPIVTIGIEDENAAAQVDAAMQALQMITVRTGACVLYVHHTPKGERGAPVDQWRGDSGAWRGSGVFYSSLDLGLTLVPWLPAECHDRQTGKECRRRWSEMVRNHRAPKYIVLDSAKERENEGLAAAMYEIVGQEVRVGGRKIGALRPVEESVAQLTATHALANMDEADLINATAMARRLLEHPQLSRTGAHKSSLREIAEWLDDGEVLGWPKDRNPDEKIRTDRGTGKRILDAFSAPITVSNRSVSLSGADKGVSVIVS